MTSRRMEFGGEYKKCEMKEFTNGGLQGSHPYTRINRQCGDMSICIFYMANLAPHNHLAFLMCFRSIMASQSRLHSPDENHHRWFGLLLTKSNSQPPYFVQHQRMCASVFANGWFIRIYPRRCVWRNWPQWHTYSQKTTNTTLGKETRREMDGENTVRQSGMEDDGCYRLPKDTIINSPKLTNKQKYCRRDAPYYWPSYI